MKELLHFDFMPETFKRCHKPYIYVAGKRERIKKAKGSRESCQTSGIDHID